MYNSRDWWSVRQHTKKESEAFEEGSVELRLEVANRFRKGNEEQSPGQMVVAF